VITTLTHGFWVGYKNNVIKVQKADFDAFEALDMDSAAVAKAAAHKRQQQVTGVKPQVDAIFFPGQCSETCAYVFSRFC
jgi:hypothetical protein